MERSMAILDVVNLAVGAYRGVESAATTRIKP